LGPEIQFADEQSNAAIEVRVYTGQDGSFVLYDDEGDNYNYEKGTFVSIEIKWLDAQGRLIFEERQGSYPGMKESLNFNILLVTEQGLCGDPCSIVYAGEKMVIDFKKQTE